MQYSGGGSAVEEGGGGGEQARVDLGQGPRDNEILTFTFQSSVGICDFLI